LLHGNGASVIVLGHGNAAAGALEHPALVGSKTRCVMRRIERFCLQ
jgi:hypothetical protein